MHLKNLGEKIREEQVLNSQILQTTPIKPGGLQAHWDLMLSSVGLDEELADTELILKVVTNLEINGIGIIDYDHIHIKLP